MTQIKVLAIVILVLSVTIPVQAQDEAKNILQDALDKATAFESFQADYELQMARQDVVLNGEIAVRNKEDLYFSFGNDTRTIKLFGDSKETVLYLTDTGRYMNIPDNQFKILQSIGNQAVNPAFITLASYLTNNETLINNIKSGEVMGTMEANGHSLTRITLSYTGYDLELWLEQSSGVLHKMQFTNPNIKNDVALSLSLSNISTNHQIEDKVFAFKPGDKDSKAASQSELFAPPENVRIGELAPDFSLLDMNGDKIQLSSFKGEKIVLLDFFASWCGPCRMGMPIIDEVAKEYKEKGVVFYAVNLREGKQKAADFLAKNKIENIDILLDLNGNIGMKYDANSIPRTVIVDKDGKVSAIHRGLSPNLKEELKKDLDKLL